MYLPSGDHAGVRSAKPAERVKFVTIPFSAGSENMSPLAATTALFPSGLIIKSVA